MADDLRIDKWLWAVRIYKTRTMAGEACRAGKVKIDGISVKPSRIIKPEDIITVSLGPLTRTVKVKALIHNRVSAKLVPESLEDLTPAEEYERIKFMQELNAERRDRGTGRPTKKERRLIDRLKGPEKP
ncbi:RNA-binding S4 domain-containing protein [Lentimicrobium sp.]|jgi:ribosome-associated heat shock protein Hsp15|uniref:RNA-binding S4 domain-containing protein n=1 Tax=Lentimicrobium sp. TaxID=2034841 RepID=UPI0025CD233B|nr:RNA-binding S4 domain-containing protein [Lentimicrobium sp.]MCO5255741.1 RNA-binding S4 domain-containing protein [Lentimicrobium sp.]MCO5263146.1 RNA-binding S4 domain-containing protein [Lentimicrobium sp.]HOP12826.1 RNA-binding S4 domain-containing protein [Lentimicrobium sp.]HPF64623.1 RNA-binding S4 domain-containing protein [Lentimicrobium sp.]HPJ62901.1 RNA-binding S4 domain-containing protein [Lentimicrobium sp.]